MADGWDCDVFVAKLNGVGEPFLLCALGVAVMDTVVFGGSVEVPAVYAVESPRASFVRFFVDLDLATHWCQRHFVVVEWATKMCIC